MLAVRSGIASRRELSCSPAVGFAFRSVRIPCHAASEGCSASKESTCEGSNLRTAAKAANGAKVKGKGCAWAEQRSAAEWLARRAAELAEQLEKSGII